MEIKFSAWDTAHKQVIPPSMVCVDGSGKIYNNSFENSSLDPKDWVLRWFTGRKDRTGKEIYSGDIVYKNIYPFKNFVVEFSNGCWNIYPYSQDSLRVVGNIYENPDFDYSGLKLN